MFNDEDNKIFDFYQNILKGLLLTVFRHPDNSMICIKNSLGESIAFNKKMVICDDYTPISELKKNLSGIVFHPLNKNIESCSMQLINDQIHILLSKSINISIETILKSHPDSTSTIRKWKNIYKLTTATSFSNNFINFSFSFNDENLVQINLEYPLFNMLQTTKDNIFGITLEKKEIELFVKIYKYIIDTIDIFENPIEVPKTSNQHSYLYILMKFYLDIKEQIDNKFHISYGVKYTKLLKEEITNLNKFTIYELPEELKKLDQESYKNELQIRKESEPNWLLLKDDEMGKNKQQPAVIENNNIGHVVDSFGNFLRSYNTKQYTNAINKFNTDMLVQEQKDNYQIWKNNQEWKDIFYLQTLVLNILKTEGGALWYDSRIKKYCFRSKLNGSISEADSKEIGDLLTRAFKEKIIHFDNNNNNNNNYNLLDYAMEIVVVSKLKGINNQKLSINEKSNDIIKILLFENEIKTIDDDAFNLNTNDEFFKNYNDFFYTQNRFLPNNYLIKRHQQNQFIATGSTEQTFIEKFIYYLAKENQELSDYILNWLAYYFKNLEKSKTALVLLGEEEVTKDIFWNIIIKEIFSQQYCTTIDDRECDTTLVSDIAKDKLFFHIHDIVDADTKFDDETLALIIKDLLIKPSVTTDINEEIYIHGQILITAKNPAPYLKKVLSKCTVIETASMDTILEKLNIEDETELENKIFEDLDNFSDMLLSYPVQENLAKNKIDTEARKILKDNITPNIDKDEIDNNIDTFIEAIKDKNLKYFKKVSGIKDKKGNDIYEQLEHAFNKDTGYFIGQDLNLYYSTIHGKGFKTNKSLMDKLKAKDEMFTQEVKTLKISTAEKKVLVLFQAYKTSKETGNKELYKIDGYRLAESINIPVGSTITSSQTSIQKFTFENEQDMEACITRTKEYNEQKASMKK